VDLDMNLPQKLDSLAALVLEQQQPLLSTKMVMLLALLLVVELVERIQIMLEWVDLNSNDILCYYHLTAQMFHKLELNVPEEITLMAEKDQMIVQMNLEYTTIQMEVVVFLIVNL